MAKVGINKSTAMTIAIGAGSVVAGIIAWGYIAKNFASTTFVKTVKNGFDS